MQFEVYAEGLATLSVDCIVLGVYEDGEMSEEAGAIDSASAGLLKKLRTRGDFSGRTGDTLLLTDVPGITASRALLTGLGLFSFDRARHRFRLESVHPGHTVEEILDHTGFGFDRPAQVPETQAPDTEWLALMRRSIRDEIAEVYPRFAAAQA